MDNFSEPYSIQHVSKMTNVSTHTLRFWERELNGIIAPLRTKGGQRRYTSYHLAIIEEVKSLKKKGLSLSDIKRLLDKSKDGVQTVNDKDRIDLLADQIAKVVKSTLYNFLKEEESGKKD